jgi:hypothetical protein
MEAVDILTITEEENPVACATKAHAIAVDLVERKRHAIDDATAHTGACAEVLEQAQIHLGRAERDWDSSPATWPSVKEAREAVERSTIILKRAQRAEERAVAAHAQAMEAERHAQYEVRDAERRVAAAEVQRLLDRHAALAVELADNLAALEGPLNVAGDWLGTKLRAGQLTTRALAERGVRLDYLLGWMQP